MALWDIKDMYLKCGRNVTSGSQEMFDRDAFIKLRQEFMDSVIEPLETQHDKKGRALQERQRQASTEQQAEHSIEEL